MEKTALILGASGRFGRHAHIAFRDAGWNVRVFDRSRDSLPDAAWGADVIVNAWNPAYSDWARDVPQFTSAVIDTAEATGAHVIVPGNVYPYGEHAPAVLGPRVPQQAKNPLGRIRLEMEAAYRNSKAQVTILRGGDFLDTEPSGNWFDRVITAKLDKGTFTVLGDLDAAHAWAYLPDMARAAVEVSQRRHRFPRFVDIPFPGYTLTARQMQSCIEEILGNSLETSHMSWLPFKLVRPFWPLAKHLLEMRYLWSMPHELEAVTFMRALPDFELTPVEVALTHAIAHRILPHKPSKAPVRYFGRARIA